MPTSDHVEYMAYPRACALAEKLWTPPDRCSWESFEERIETHLKRLKDLKVNYYKGPLSPKR